VEGQPSQQYQHGYGTFQGQQAGSGEFRNPPVGYPQPAPPPGFGGGGYQQQQKPYVTAEPHYGQGYQSGQGMASVSAWGIFLLALLSLGMVWWGNGEFRFQFLLFGGRKW
jgi:hypothetical protein